jgi:prepilin-type N-terminal cleavage/methylation domain-containing protein
MNRPLPIANRNGFTFVEAIFTIAIIGIMASLVVSAISNASRDANRVVARQQQAAINEALQAWVMSQMRVAGSGQIQSVDLIRADYNSRGTTQARFNLIIPMPTATTPDLRTGFLDQSTATHFLDYTTNSERLKSAALDGARQYIVLPNWIEGEAPTAEIVNE